LNPFLAGPAVCKFVYDGGCNNEKMIEEIESGESIPTE
jgi:hypothetical protein